MGYRAFLFSAVSAVALTLACGSGGSSGGGGNGGVGGTGTGGTGGTAGVSGSAGQGGAAGQGMVPLAKDPIALPLFGTRMVVVHYWSKMEAWDVSSNTSPVLLDNDIATFNARGATLEITDKLFVAGIESGGMAVFSSTGGRETYIEGRRPGQNFVVNQFALAAPTYLLAAVMSQGTGYEGEVAVYDIADPKNASYVTSFTVGTAEIGSQGVTVDETRKLAFVFDNTFLRAFDVSDPTAPAEAGNTPHSVTVGGPYPERLRQALRGTTLFAISGPKALTQDFTLDVFDVSDLANLHSIAEVPVPDCTLKGIDLLKNDYVLVRCKHDLRLFDASDPQNPTAVGQPTTLDSGIASRLEGDILYLGTPKGAFHVLNVADPTALQVLHSPPLP